MLKICLINFDYLEWLKMTVTKLRSIPNYLNISEKKEMILIYLSYISRRMEKPKEVKVLGKPLCSVTLWSHSFSHSLLLFEYLRTLKNFFPNSEEKILDDLFTREGQKVRTTVCVDHDHADDLGTRKHITGIMVMMNSTPIRRVSVRQKTIETSTIELAFCYGAHNQSIIP
jgi:hypothetical protein